MVGPPVVGAFVLGFIEVAAPAVGASVVEALRLPPDAGALVG